MSTDPPPDPKRGEIWVVDLNPTVGDEMSKQRRALVISSDAVGVLRIKLVAPITEWSPAFDRYLWHVSLQPDPDNGQTKRGSIDVLQTRCVAVDPVRFLRRVGRVSASVMDEVAAAMALIVEFQP